MSKTRPNLSLALKENEIKAQTRDRRIQLFHKINFERDIKADTKKLLKALNSSLDAGNNLKTRKLAVTEVERLGFLLFNAIFQVSSIRVGGGFLDELLSELIIEASSKPLEIKIDGDWYALPWELLRMPKGFAGLKNDVFLGEIAIIASDFKVEDDTMNVCRVIDKLQIVSVAGNKRLSYAREEINFIKSLNSENLRPLRVLSEFPTSRKAEVSHTNYDRFIEGINSPFPANLLHGAFHSNTPNGESTFEITVDKNAKLVSQGFMINGKRPLGAHIAFFNTCQGIATGEWFGGGIGRYALQRWGSHPVITSIAKINDNDASIFSNIFLKEILPMTTDYGLPVGVSLLKARNEWLKREGPEKLLGLSYRILGNPRRYFKVVREAENAA